MPFSFFNGVTSDPPILSLAVSTKRDGSKKDTWRNIEETGEVVVNVVVPDRMDAVILAARELPHNDRELDLARLATLPSAKIRPPRIGDSPVQMECTLLRNVEVEETGLNLGRGVRVHAREEVVEAGRIVRRRLTFVGRMGGDSCCRAGDTVERRRD